MLPEISFNVVVPWLDVVTVCTLTPEPTAIS